MKKIFFTFAALSLIFIESCTNSTDEPTPVIILVDDLSVSIDENPTAGTVIGTINATVSEGTLTYAIAQQNPEGAIAVSDQGAISVADASVFDFEVNPQITASVNVVSGSTSELVVVTISVNDVSENEGLVVNDFSIEIDESPSNGAELGTISASSSEGAVTFSITNQNPAGALSVGANTGVLEVADGSLFLFAINPTITATVEVTDGVETKELAVTVDILKPLNIWTGGSITFTKAAGSDPNNEANQDRITDNVWITRGNSGGQIFNIRVESSANKNSSPADTEWAEGTTDQIRDLTFRSFRSTVSPKSVVGKPLVLHLITDDIYIDVEFTQWSQGRQGGFAYRRSTED